MTIESHLTRVASAVDAIAHDPKHQAEHLQAALRATGDLQRELILSRLALDQPTTRRPQNRSQRKSKGLNNSMKVSP